MTRIYAERDGPRHVLSAKGHAQPSPAACAAVSAILYALAGYLRNAEAEITALRLESGDAYLEFYGAEEAFEMAVIGLLQVAKAQPEAVEVEVRT